jgi:hypothetical protein
MIKLAEHIALRRPDLRSVNLETDVGDPFPLKAYAPSTAALELLDEIASSIEAGPRLRAWTVIGPYGAGKSTFAHLVAALFGDSRPALRSARASLRTVDGEAAKRIGSAARRLAGSDSSAVIAAATAKPEPLAALLARALDRGAASYWGARPGRNPACVSRAAELSARGAEVKPEEVLELLGEVTSKTPVVLLLDEFGKVLEYSARHRDADLYLAQQAAELLSNDAVPKGFVVTLQHLSFDDYARTLPEASRQEWRKVEGRFGRAIFSASGSHAVQLVSQALEPDLPADLEGNASSRIAACVDRLDGKVDTQVALGDIATYPLDPVTVPVAASLAGQLGQHDRSLSAFLASGAAHSVAWHLQQEREGLPFVLPHDAYAYFVNSASLADLASGGERYREIHGRVVEAEHLPELEFDLLRAIGALNLTASGLGVKASKDVLKASYSDSAGNDEAAVEDALDSLVARGLVTFRRFADEYRVWEGSDFEVNARIREHAQQLSVAEDPTTQLRRLAEQFAPPRARVARRHSYEQKTLRYFGARYATTVELGSIEASDGADGVIALLLDDLTDEIPPTTPSGRPLIILAPGSLAACGDRALELAAAISVRDESPELERDPVARREVDHRLGFEQLGFVAALDAAFHPSAEGVRVFAEGRAVEVADLIELERLLSNICDTVFHRSTPINSEMLNREELTSQGAKARRELMLAMFESEASEHLGIEGNGPERAMYDSVLGSTGIHGSHGGSLGFGPPPKGSAVAPLWRSLIDWLDEAAETPTSIQSIYDRLTGPPFGMKTGPIPVILGAALLARREDVMVYQDGSYIPRLGAEHLERLVKTPERFSVKRFPSEEVSAAIFSSLAANVGSAVVHDEHIRNRGALEVIAPLIEAVRSLSDHARKTQRVSGTAQAVRSALLTTREPDELLFKGLPEACGMEPISDSTTPEEAQEFAATLGEAIRELVEVQANLRSHCQHVLAAAFSAEGSRLRDELARRSRGIEKHVIEPKMRAFVLLAQDEGLDDEDWLDGMAMNLVDKPTTTWTDTDITVFEAAAKERGRWFSRLELLFHDQSANAGDNRLTVTGGDGSEASTLLPSEAGDPSVIAEILANASQRLGDDAERQLLAALAERLLGTGEDSEAKEAG